MEKRITGRQGDRFTKESDKEIKDRLIKLCAPGNYDLSNPPMRAQVAVLELARYILGEDWYSEMPVSIEQLNTEIVYLIEARLNGRRIK